MSIDPKLFRSPVTIVHNKNPTGDVAKQNHLTLNLSGQHLKIAAG
jgi:hypothetical protein